MSLNLTLTHNTSEHGAVITMTAESLDAAIAHIQAFVRGTAPQASSPALIEGGGEADTTKKPDAKSDKSSKTSDAKPDTKTDSAKGSTAEPTPTASDNLANSSTASPKTDASAAKDSDKGDDVELTYEANIKPLVLEVSKKSREFAVAMLQRFGALQDGKPSAQALHKDQWPRFIEYAKRIIAGEIDPTASHEEEDAIA